MRRRRIDLATLADRLFEVWPRDMAPGYYDMVVGTCRTAGFEPRLDEQAAGNTVWGNLARGRGVVLINASLAEQLPTGVTLADLAPPAATLTFDAVWHERASAHPALHRSRCGARQRCGVAITAISRRRRRPVGIAAETGIKGEELSPAANSLRRRRLIPVYQHVAHVHESSS